MEPSVSDTKHHPGPAGPATAPHPVLRKYYDSESARQPFVNTLFDNAADHYDWICAVGSLGSGRFYRRWVLRRSGLRAGMKLLDVATGTGLVAREAARILGDPRGVVGLDPSRGMLREAKKTLASPLVQGIVEELPFASDHFDLVSMGYALRHVADLGVAFRQCLRVLKPGGRVIFLEITRPRSAVGRGFFRAVFDGILPRVTRIGTGSAEAELLMKYYSETMVHCVSPDMILDVLRSSGFVDVKRRVFGGLFSEYVGAKPR